MTNASQLLSDERLVAYADGELPEADALALEEALSNDPPAAERLRALVEAGEMARRAFAEIVEEPVPERLRTAVMEADTSASPEDDARHPEDTKPADNVVRLPQRPASRRSTWQPVALAASLAVAVAAGIFTWLPGGQDGAGLTPQLADALSHTPSYEPVQLAEGDLTILGSFRSQDDRLCREYEQLSGDSGERGLACRATADSDWQLVASSPIPPADQMQDGTFRPAGTEDSDPVSAAVERLQAGSLLTAEEEQRALGF